MLIGAIALCHPAFFGKWSHPEKSHNFDQLLGEKALANGLSALNWMLEHEIYDEVLCENQE